MRTTKKTIIAGNWQSVADIFSDFNVAECEGTLIYAIYETPCYEGNAFVLFRHKGKLYEVNGSHCSCMGLEGQWEPEETTLETLKMREFYGDAATSEFIAGLK